MTLTGVTVRTTEAKRGREGEEAGASPQEGPLGRGETGWMMTSWWTDLTVRTTLQKKKKSKWASETSESESDSDYGKKKKKKGGARGKQKKMPTPRKFFGNKASKRRGGGWSDDSDS